MIGQRQNQFDAIRRLCTPRPGSGKQPPRVRMMAHDAAGELLALGASFRGLEVVPLTLVGYEAWEVRQKMSKSPPWDIPHLGT